MGAGGIGISALMELCAARGAIVTGCDCSSSGQVAALKGKGMSILRGHCASHVEDCDELVYSAAIESSHPEIQAAKKKGKVAHVRMTMLGQIAQGNRSICVTGAHGKTTTTWLIANLLMKAGRDPSVLLGGIVQALGGNVHLGSGDEFVAEVDESDNRLHEVLPTIPVLTNIDNDHLENYGDIEALEEASVRFMSSLDSTDPRAILVGCGDDVRVRRVLAAARLRSGCPGISYGLDASCDIRGINLRDQGMGSHFDVVGPFGIWEGFELPMPGEHNVVNALAAISVGWHLGIEAPVMRAAFSGIERVGRRFEIKGEKSGIRIVDDYGHHPTEIDVTLRAARGSTQRRLGVIFQPHRYSRTAALMDQFAGCFTQADAVFLMPIYAAGEQPIDGVDHHALARAIRAHGQMEVVTSETRMEAVELALKWVTTGDTIITQGAGDVTKAADELVARL